MSKLRFMPNYDEPSENLELYGDVYRYPLSTSLESSFEESARMEKDPFENVLLGGFILALGYKLVVTCINKRYYRAEAVV